jgi:hypothetical protein
LVCAGATVVVVVAVVAWATVVVDAAGVVVVDEGVLVVDDGTVVVVDDEGAEVAVVVLVVVGPVVDVESVPVSEPVAKAGPAVMPAVATATPVAVRAVTNLLFMCSCSSVCAPPRPDSRTNR